MDTIEGGVEVVDTAIEHRLARAVGGGGDTAVDAAACTSINEDVAGLVQGLRRPAEERGLEGSQRGCIGGEEFPMHDRIAGDHCMGVPTPSRAPR